MLKQTHDVRTGLGRLAKLADDLATINFRPGEFNLGSWSCGTSACAVGWCCTFDWANEQGLLFQGNAPHYNLRVGYEAVSEFFGITLNESEYLFAPTFGSLKEGRMEDPVAQSEHMRAFLKNKGYYL